MDFIVELPASAGFNAIYVCVDRLTKMAHFIPTTTEVSAEETALLFYRHVWKHHGLPTDIVSDRGAQFISKFTRRLLEIFDIKGNRSTSHHPQTDGQTERVNQTLEQYLRVYCDYQQDDWHFLLPLAEFVYNNMENSSTKTSPFFAMYGTHPKCTLTIVEESNNPRAEDFAKQIEDVRAVLKANLKTAQEQYKRSYDKHAIAAPNFQVGDKVWLNRRNIRTTRPSQKLDVKRMGPFRISKKIGDAGMAYRLELPGQMRIHPVFHVSLLEPYVESGIRGRKQEPPLPVEVEGEVEYEVERVLDSRVVRGKLRYFVDWRGYGPESRTWEPVEYLAHATDAINRYHRENPHRPSPQNLVGRPPRKARRQ